jgi:hypothetical protein
MLKVKFFPLTRHEAPCESGAITPQILNLGSGLRYVVNFTPWPIYLRESFSVTNKIKGCLGPGTVLTF